MSIQPQGENIRNAVKWISEKQKYEIQTNAKILAQKACAKFDLSPKEAEFLERFVREEAEKG